jgi:hypothetical protein
MSVAAVGLSTVEKGGGLPDSMLKIQHFEGAILRSDRPRARSRMLRMDLIPCPATAARERCDDRARRLVRVKFVSLPVESTPPARRSPFIGFLSRVIGRLVAARP